MFVFYIFFSLQLIFIFLNGLLYFFLMHFSYFWCLYCSFFCFFLHLLFYNMTIILFFFYRTKISENQCSILNNKLLNAIYPILPSSLFFIWVSPLILSNTFHSISLTLLIFLSSLIQSFILFAAFLTITLNFSSFFLLPFYILI